MFISGNSQKCPFPLLGMRKISEHFHSKSPNFQTPLHLLKKFYFQAKMDRLFCEICSVFRLVSAQRPTGLLWWGNAKYFRGQFCDFLEAKLANREREKETPEKIFVHKNGRKIGKKYCGRPPLTLGFVFVLVKCTSAV